MPITSPSRSRPGATPLFLAALFGAASLVGLALPARFWSALPELCLFYRWSGRPCPTCGLTRSWAALLHADAAAAFRFHLLGPWLFLGLAGLLAWQLRRPRPALPGRGWGVALGLIWSGYALARMFGWMPAP